VIAKTTTTTGGAYTFPVAPQVNTIYRVNVATVNSAEVFQGVKYVLAIGATPTTVASGTQMTIEGTVAPIHMGHAVYLERENRFGGGYHVVDSVPVNAEGKFTITDGVVGSGKTSFRVKIPGDPSNQAASTKPFTVEITPAPPTGITPSPLSPALPAEGQV
jgi:hypothetical protein